MSGTRSRNTNRTNTWPYVVQSLIDRYVTDTGPQEACDRVTLIAQIPNETENDYADRIAVAARDCAMFLGLRARPILRSRTPRSHSRKCDQRPAKTVRERTKRHNGYPRTGSGGKKYLTRGRRQGRKRCSSIGPTEKPKMPQDRTIFTP